MNTRKCVVKIAYGLDAALIIVLIGFLFYQRHIIRQILDNREQMSLTAVVSGPDIPDENNTQTALQAKQTHTVGDGGVERLADKVEQLRFRLETVEEELETAREALADAKGPDEEFQEMLMQDIAFAKKERENPTLMEAKHKGAEEGIVNNYGAFFEQLDVPDENVQELIALMADNEIDMEYFKIYAGGRLPPWTDEVRKELQQQIEDQEAGFETQMRELLGTDNYEIYNHYVETDLERSTIANLGLSDEKAQALVDVLYEARKEVETRYDGFDAGVLSSDGEQIDRLIEVQDAYMESARSVLSESQFAEFEAGINEEKEMLKNTWRDS